jgi:hypothetical protein
MSLLDKVSLCVTPNAYKESKLYSVVPNTTLGDMDVVRATTATRVNSSGLISSVGVNIPRIDYTNGSCPSILVEPQRTNLLIFSNDFIANWLNDGTTTRTANAGISPDGTQNATKIVGTGGYGYRFTPILSVGTYNYSIYVRSSAPSNINIAINDIGGSGRTTISIAVTTNWQRFNITKNVTLGTSVIIAYEELDLGIDYYVYNCQLEAGSYATSLIPTVASTVTRNADVISKTGISSLIGQTEGTIFVDVNYEAEGIFKYYLTLGNSSSSYIAILARANNKIGMEVVNSGVQVNAESASVYTTKRLKIAMTYKLNDFKLYVNGVLQATDTSGTIPSRGEVLLGNSATSAFQAMDGINSALIFKTALTDTQCINLTTI